MPKDALITQGKFLHLTHTSAFKPLIQVIMNCMCNRNGPKTNQVVYAITSEGAS